MWQSPADSSVALPASLCLGLGNMFPISSEGFIPCSVLSPKNQGSRHRRVSWGAWDAAEPPGHGHRGSTPKGTFLSLFSAFISLPCILHSPGMRGCAWPVCSVPDTKQPLSCLEVSLPRRNANREEGPGWCCCSWALTL